ncbi:uncharacterized protein [Ptychodera flava]|uniref:uncharacterized protein n=1 Tax=Ptychodera flava TaxID=63121 RepID=UPI00396A3C4F
MTEEEGFVSWMRSSYDFVEGWGDLLNANDISQDFKNSTGRTISCNMIGRLVGSAFSAIRRSITNVLTLISQLRVCRGKENVLRDDTMCEKWSKVDSSDAEFRLRSPTCEGVLSFTKTATYCRKCTQTAWRSLTKDQSCSHNDSDSFLDLDENDKDDLNSLWDKLKNKIGDMARDNEKLSLLLESQKENLCENDVRKRKWHPRIIQLCLTLWARSPQAYNDLRESGFLVLPTGRLLRYYKHSIKQEADFNRDVMHWMHIEAKKHGKEDSWTGGIIFDEMSIQEDLHISKRDGKWKLVGFVDNGSDNQVFDLLLKGKKEPQLATHVLQLVYLAGNGFRFPIAHYPTKEATALQLTNIFWKAVSVLSSWGFQVQYACMDGSSSNRSFIKMHFDGNPRHEAFMMPNLFNPLQKVIFIMDPSHIFKKIRNNLLKSGFANFHVRQLKHKGNYITWEHWIRAYQWDQRNNSVRVHRRLTDEHLFPNPQQKMRNKLAEQVLDVDMLSLMKDYQHSTTNTGLGSTIELLENTSTLVKNFRDVRPITSWDDERLKQNEVVLNWFTAWEEDIKKSNLPKKEQEASLMSYQTRDDIASLLMGFKQLCYQKVTQKMGSTVPARLNSDIVENLFCQQRAKFNGSNSNPTYLQYCNTMNSIILGQSTKSQKSNTSDNCATPFALSTSQPLKRRKLSVIN